MNTLYSVSELCAELKDMLRENFPTDVQVRGELGELTQAGSGHWYFSLKDEEAQLECVMFKGANARVGDPPPQGVTVTLNGELSFYQGRGRFQLVVHNIQVGKLGDFQKRYEALKVKLLAEGLFDKERKKSMPSFIQHLGLITSESGAALHDVIQVLGRRMPLMRISFFPVMVQGEEAPSQIRAALTRANEYDGLDAILITRGGGSGEDLRCFNDEDLVRAIAASSLPVMTAIGHEVDYTLVDFAADKRAPTPSAAAEILSIDSAELLIQMKEQAAYIERVAVDKVRNEMQQSDDLQCRLMRNDPYAFFQKRLEDLFQRLQKGIKYYHSQLCVNLAQLQERLFTVAPYKQQQQRAVELRATSIHLDHSIWNLLAMHRQRLKGWQDVIHSLSPQSVLERGYSLVTDKNGQLIRTTSHIKVKDILAVQLAFGRFDAEVQRVFREEQDELDFQ